MAWEGPEAALHHPLQGSEGSPPLGDSWELGFREGRPGVEVTKMAFQGQLGSGGAGIGPHGRPTVVEQIWPSSQV